MQTQNEIERKAKLIFSDPRFSGTYSQALEIASELESGIRPDPNAMVRKQ